MIKHRPFGTALALVAIAALLLVTGAPATPAQQDEAKPQAEAAPETPEKKKKSLWNFLRGRTNGEEKAKKPEPAEEEAEAEPAPEPAPTELESKETEKAQKELDKLEKAADATGSPEVLEAVQARLKASVVAKDPTGRAYLDFVDRGAASAAHLNEFAIYLAERGLVNDALEYQKEAIRIDDDDPVLWVNLGTLHRDSRNESSAMAAFKRAIAIDPNHALAHYNLGVSYDARRDYDRAIEEYRIALTLDPSLADPLNNPQIVNNDRMLAVNLMLYQQKAGALGLPLISKPEGRARP